MGADGIRMRRSLLGPENIRKGADLYFVRHDGQAVTCEEFVRAMEEASGVDLAQFRLWYSQAGTRRVAAELSPDAASKTADLVLRQTVPSTPGPTERQP